MAGKHEPPTQGSFYFSLATTTLRYVLLAALIALGVVGLTKVFPSNSSASIAPPPTGAPATPTITTSPKATKKPPATPSPKVQGVVVQVLNGTSATGLAASTSSTLENAGYTMDEPANYSSNIETTLIYYRSTVHADAQYLKTKFFPTAELKQAPASVPQDVQIQVVLGEDFATG